MEKYCISLEQAGKLDRLGFNKESYLVWTTNIAGEFVLEKAEDYFGFPAYHVGELGDILHDSYSDIFYKSLGRWLFKSWEPQATNLNFDGEWPTEAQARGQLLIYLLENSLL